MDSTTATIVSATAVAGGTHLAVLIRDKGRGPHLVRPIVGTALLTGALLLIAQFWPTGARGLAVVVLLTALVLNGGKVFQMLSSLVD